MHTPEPVTGMGKGAAVVVGAGPNGLAAAIHLARAGVKVLVLEAGERPGGAVSSAEVTLPGFIHDLGSAIHPMAVASPFFRTLGLERHGLEWVWPQFPLAHPLDETTVLLRDGVEETAAGLGADDDGYRRLIGPLAAAWEGLTEEILQPLAHIPRRPVALARFGMRALWPAETLGRVCFKGEAARALFAGLAAHSFLPQDAAGSSAIGLALAMIAHGPGWPFPRGGAQRLADALAACLRAAGGEIVCGARVKSLAALPDARAVLLDVSPRQFLALAGDRLPAGYRDALGRYRHAPGVFKIDYALDGPVPWRAAACGRAGTIHVCGSAAEVIGAERAVAAGRVPDRPFVLCAQHTPFDPTRAPAGRHTLWAYCHIPYGSMFDMTGRVEAQIERFAPGFRDRVLARLTMGPERLEAWNPNLDGGDISGGANTLWQLLARPVVSAQPYRTPLRGVYLCSASTPPAGGVHGMCGYNAARLALREVFGVG